MHLIELNAGSWKATSDIYADLLPALGAPAWHGDSIDALLDTTIWGGGGINTIDPPFSIRIRNSKSAPQEVRDHLKAMADALQKARGQFRQLHGRDIEARLDVE